MVFTFHRLDGEGDIEKFLFNYVNQFETVLMYVKSTREGDGDLHLHSLFELLKYFFAHNNLTYARVLSLQFHAFQKFAKENPDLWNKFKSNFFITKNIKEHQIHVNWSIGFNGSLLHNSSGHELHR